jgi:hypothetical protein
VGGGHYGEIGGARGRLRSVPHVVCGTGIIWIAAGEKDVSTHGKRMKRTLAI